MANKGTILIGPWGGPDGKRVDFRLPLDTSIREIQIGHANNGGVHFLKFKSFDNKTKLTKESEQWGSGRASEDATASKYPKITFGENEYLTNISGTTAKLNEFKESIVVQSLTFYTNTNKSGYGPYGPTTGTAFEVPIENGKVVGFFGLAETYIYAIGIHVIPHAP